MTWTPERAEQVRERAAALKAETSDPDWDGWGIGIAVGEYIEHTPQDVTDLLAEVERLLGEIDTLDALLAEAHEMTPEMVGRAARALHSARWPNRDWHQIHAVEQAALRRRARAALTAALSTQEDT